MEDDDDPVVHEVDVMLSKSLAENLYLFQYPVRPSHMVYDEVTHLGARIKPKQQKVELELSLNTRSANYASSKGEQIALNVDGATGEGTFYSSDKMDKQVLSSQSNVTDTSRYAVGVLKEGELHLTPLHGLVQLRPSFNYLDHADVRQKEQLAAGDAGDSSQDEEEEAKPVTVRFSRPESDEAKARRLASYEYLHKQREEEHWVNCRYFQLDEDKSETEYRQLFCSQQGKDVTEFCTGANDYLKTLIPEKAEDEEDQPALPNNVLSMAQLKYMPLSDQIRALLVNAKIISFDQLLRLLPKATDIIATLRWLQQVAMLVQGNWVVKSDVLYPKDSCSAHSGVPAEVLSRGRDYVMWKFTQNRYVMRKEVTSAVKLPPEDVKDILEQMAQMKVKLGWEFRLPFDEAFVNRYPDVVQRQKMLWEARHQQLMKSLKTKEAMASPEKPKRRRTTSRSRHKSGGEKSMSDQSDTDLDSARKDLTTKLESKDTMDSKNISNGPNVGANANNDIENNTPSLELKTELLNFIQEKLYSRYVLSLSDLKKLYQIKLAQCPPGHILGSRVSDSLLQQTVIEVGAAQLQVKWPSHLKEEPIFALVKTGDKMDQARAVMCDMFKTTHRLKSNSFRKKYEDESGEVLSDSDMRKLLKDYCVCKGSGWYLKCLAPSDS